MEKDIEQKFDELLITIKKGFDGVSDEFIAVKKDIKNLKTDVRDLKTDVRDLKQDMRAVKSTMVTKDFVTDKNADLAAEIGSKINRRHQEQRLFNKKHVEFLKRDKGVITPDHVAELEEMLA